MRDDQDVFAALQFHNDGLQADDHIAIRLSTKVAVVVLVLVTLRKVLGVLLLDLCIRQAIAHARIELVERFPLKLLEWKEACGLDCSF